MKFSAAMGNHQVDMDARAPIGSDSAATPKQLLLSAIAGCTAMDIVALLKKHKQDLQSLTIEAEGELTSGYPSVFREIELHFAIAGEIDPKLAVEAVELSQTKYCGVSAMVAKVSPLVFRVDLNGQEIHRGHANFPA